MKDVMLLKIIEAVDKLESLAGFPAKIKIDFSVIYMGPIKDIVSIEIRDKDSKLGWLYSDAKYVLFKADGKIWIADKEEAKTMIEGRLSEKRFIGEDDQPQLDRIQKESGTGRITGFIHVDDLIKISKKA